MFARGIETDRSLREIAVQDILKRSGKPPDEAEVQEWCRVMEALLADVRPGVEYVYLDGAFLPATFGAVSLEGWYAQHQFRLLPHVESRSTPGAYGRELGQESYWRAAAIERE